MPIYFSSFRQVADPYAYVFDKLAGLDNLTPERHEQLAIDTLQTALSDQAVPPLAAPEQLPAHSPRHVAYLSHVATARSPLTAQEQTGEVLDTPSFLTADYKGAPAGTLVLKRQTNQADAYYVFTGSYVRDGVIHRLRVLHEEQNPLEDGHLASVQVLPAPAPKAGPVPAAPSNDPFTWGAIAYSLASGIASAIGSQIGSAVYMKVLKSFGLSNVPGWYEEVYERFTQIIKQALDEERRRTLGVNLKQVIGLIEEYQSTRNGAILNNAWGQARNLMDALKEMGYTAAANFAVAGTAYLSILQDQAATQPDSERYDQTIRERAADLAKWLREAFNPLVQDRLAKVTNLEWLPAMAPATGGDWRWRDLATGKSELFFDGFSLCTCGRNPRQEAIDSRNAYYAQLKSDTERELQPLLQVAAEWEKLIQHPRPAPALRHAQPAVA